MKPGPWTQGPALLQQLALLKGMNLSELDPVGAEFVHLVTETSKLALADREKYYGDPNFVDVPMARLLSSEYNDARRRLIGRDCSMEFRPGAIKASITTCPIASAAMRETPRWAPASPRSGRADRCAATPSISTSSTGSAISYRRRRAAAGCRARRPFPVSALRWEPAAQMFWLRRGCRRRCARQAAAHHALAVSGLRDGEPYGVRHARRRPAGQWSSQFFLRHAHHGMNLQRRSTRRCFITITCRARSSPPGATGVADDGGALQRYRAGDLRSRGHQVEIVDAWSLGRISAVSKTGRMLRAAANPRYMQGYAFGR